MLFNETLEAVEITVGFISLVPLLVGFFFITRMFFRERHRHLLYLAIMTVFGGLACLFEILWLLMDVYAFNALYRTSMLVTALFTFLLIDTASRESVDPFKIGFFMFFVGGFYMFYLLDAATTLGWVAVPASADDAVNYFTTLVTNIHNFGYIGIYAFILFIMCMAFAYWVLKVFRNVPANLKKAVPTYMMLAGGLVIAALPIVGLVSEFAVDIPGSDLVLAAIGILLIATALTIEPKLAYVLPFKTYRVTVVDNVSGISIYNHVWAKGDEGEEVTDENLFSGMLQGISSFVQESMKKGSLREIHLEHAILILERAPEKNVEFVLVVSKTSRVLRDALTAFKTRFVTEYAEALKDSSNMAGFRGVDKILEECFPFVPEYEKQGQTPRKTGATPSGTPEPESTMP